MAIPTASLDFDGSTDWLSMSDANFGAVSNQIICLAASIRPDVVTSFRGIIGQATSSNTNTSYNLYTDTSRVGVTLRSGGTASLYTTNTGVIVTGVWTALLLVIDLTQATNGDRLKLYVNGVLTPFTTYPTAPNTMDNSGEDVCIGAIEGGFKFDGLINQPTLGSGTVWSPSDVFNGNGPGLKDLSGLPGVVFCHHATSATADAVHGTAWTNNGSVSTSALWPDASKPSRRNVTSANFAGVTSINITKPAGVAPGQEFLIRAAWDATGDPDFTPPSGFTLHTDTSIDMTNMRCVAYTRTADGSEGSSFALNWDAAAEGGGLCTSIADTSGIVAYDEDFTTGNRTTATIPDISVTDAGSYGLIFVSRGLASTSINIPTNYASVGVAAGSDATDGAGENWRDRADMPSGATGTIGITSSSSTELAVGQYIYGLNTAPDVMPWLFAKTNQIIGAGIVA